MIRLVTISFDDGHPLDLKAAELLNKYGLNATFYIPVRSIEDGHLTKSDINFLASQFEIGSHTKTHAVLKGLNFAKAREEIYESKEFWEDLLSKPVSSFCYPKGKYDKQASDLVREAGYLGARTARWLSSDPGKNAYAYHPTMHLYPHRFHINLAHMTKWMDVKSIARYVQKGFPEKVFALAQMSINLLLEKGGTLHFWGHSWELENCGLWSEVEDIFKMLASYNTELQFVNNTQILKALYWT